MLNGRIRRSLEVLDELEGIEFAVTGSYAKKVLEAGNSRSRFGDSSDIDVSVLDSELELAYRRLKSSKYLISGAECFGYDGFPSPDHKGYLLEIIEGVPIHLVSTFDENQRDRYIEVNGINYLSPDYWKK